MRATIRYQLHNISSTFRTILAALAGFAEGAGLGKVLVFAIMSWMALLYPYEKRLVVLFKLLRHEQVLNKLSRAHGAWLEHTRRAHVQTNV